MLRPPPLHVRAGRRLASADDPEVEVERTSKEISTVAPDERVKLITDDPVEREAYVKRVELMQSELQAGDHEPVVRPVCRTAAIAWLESFFADLTFYRVVGVRGGVATPMARALIRWRAHAERRLMSAYKTLACVRRIDVSSVEATRQRLRLKVV
jgi:hypothetical protein